MSKSHCVEYLDYTLHVLFVRALEAKTKCLAELQIDGVDAASFSSGYALAYHHCLETLMAEAKDFGLPIGRI